MAEDKKSQQDAAGMQKPDAAVKVEMVDVVLNRPYISVLYGLSNEQDGLKNYPFPLNPGTVISVTAEEADRLRRKGYVV